MDTLVIQESDIKRFRWLGDMLGTKFAKCSKCGAFLTDALEWANKLRPISDSKYNDNNSEEETEFGEYVHEILHQLMKYAPEIEDIEEWEAWNEKKDRFRYLFTTEELQDAYIVYSDVLVYKNKRCSCFNQLKKQKK